MLVLANAHALCTNCFGRRVYSLISALADAIFPVFGLFPIVGAERTDTYQDSRIESGELTCM